MGKWNLREMLPVALAHTGNLAAAAVLGIALVAVPVGFWSLSKSASTPDGGSRERVAAPTEVANPKTPDGATSSSAHETQLIAFYGNFDETGYGSLERNAKEIDVLMPMWYHLGNDGTITFDSSHAARVREIIKAQNPGMKVMPILNNYDKATELWNAPQVAAMIANPDQRASIAQNIVDVMRDAGYDGVNIDFESFTAADRANLVAFMADLYPRAQAAGLEVSMDVNVTSATYDNAALAQHADYLIPMLYDEHWKTSPAGPISSLPWFESTLQRLLQQVPADKVVVGMGTYSYDWAGPGARARSLTWNAAVGLAQQYQAPVGLTQPELNSAFSYAEGTNVHSVWMLDAVSAFNQLSAAKKYGVRGYAIWRLGAEDPSLWNVLPRRDALDRAAAESLANTNRSIAFDDASNLITGSVSNY